MPDVTTHLVERQIHRWSRVDAILGKGQPRPEGETSSPKPVITISRDVGCGARLIAKDLSERLKMDLFGIAITEAIADSSHLEQQVADTLDETARSGMENWILGLLRGQVIHNQEYAVRLARAITVIASHGRAILLGRGANRILGERADLRLRFYAPKDQRVRNLMAYDNIGEDEAGKKVEAVDKARREFIERIFEGDINDPRQYDMAIDTSRLSTSACVELAVQALRARLSPEAWEAFRSQKVGE